MKTLTLGLTAYPERLQHLGRATLGWLKMAKLMLPYLQILRAKGRQYGYYRRAGIRTKISGDIGSAEFLAEYQAIHAQHETKAKAVSPGAEVKPGSLKALWLAYRSSAEWKGLSLATQAGYTRLIEPLLPRWGGLPVKDMPPEWIMRRRDALADTPSKANHFLGVMRLLLNWSIPRGWIKVSPAAQIKAIRHRAKSHRIWAEDEIAAMTGPDAAVIALPILIALHTAQRLGDVLRLPWSAYDGQSITVAGQGKTGVRVVIPALPALREALDTTERKAVMICARPDGKAWKTDHFKHKFAAIRASLGLPNDLHFHGLRHSAASRLAEAGCTPHEIAAVTGHKSLAMVSRYTQQAQQEALASAAIMRLEKRNANPSGKPGNRKV